MDALAMGFDAVLVKDVTCAISEEGFRAAEKAIIAKGGTIVLSTQI